MAHDVTAHDDHQPHFSSWAIFIALCICTAVSWLADEAFGWGLINSRKVIAVLVLAIAVAKAQFVMRYFMHLSFEGRWKYVLLLPTAILACGLPLALAPDIALHYYAEDPELSLAFDASHHGDSHHAETLDTDADKGPSHELAPGEGGDEGSDRE